MTAERRTRIVNLCRAAGLPDLRVAEVEHGCTADRCVRILITQLDDVSRQPGLLTLRDGRAAVRALDLAYGALP